MRLDLFLKVSRLVKRRTLAQELCQRGWVELNGMRAKPGKEVKEGDRLLLNLGARKKEIEILCVPKGNVRACEVHKLYKIISDIKEKEGDLIY